MRKIIALAIFFCLGAHFNAHAQHRSLRGTSDFAASDSPTARRPFIRNYNPKEYGAAFNYWAIAQDQRGVMYFGN